MFKRAKETAAPRPSESRPAILPRGRAESSTTLIGSGTKMSGVLRVNGSLRIDGEAEGQVFVSEDLVVGPGGAVRAELHVGSAIVGGRVKGHIRARERVELQRGARLEGDVQAASFKIEDGAFFQGNCEMGERRAAPSAEASAKERAPLAGS